MIGTATDLHFELCHAHERGRAWDLWCAIEDYHVLRDASRRYEAWMMLFAVRKTPDEKCCDMYRRIEEARNSIVRVIPADLTSRQQFDEIVVTRHKSEHAVPLPGHTLADWTVHRGTFSVLLGSTTRIVKAMEHRENTRFIFLYAGQSKVCPHLFNSLVSFSPGGDRSMVHPPRR